MSISFWWFLIGSACLRIPCIYGYDFLPSQCANLATRQADCLLWLTHRGFNKVTDIFTYILYKGIVFCFKLNWGLPLVVHLTIRKQVSSHYQNQTSKTNMCVRCVSGMTKLAGNFSELGWCQESPTKCKTTMYIREYINTTYKIMHNTCLHRITVTWAPWRLKSPTTPLLHEEVVQANNKVNITYFLNDWNSPDPYLTLQWASNAESFSTFWRFMVNLITTVTVNIITQYYHCYHSYWYHLHSHRHHNYIAIVY